MDNVDYVILELCIHFLRGGEKGDSSFQDMMMMMVGVISEKQIFG